MINQYGGKMDNTAGIPEEQLRRAAASAVCKVNIDSDGRLAMTAVIRKIFAEKPGEFDPAEIPRAGPRRTDRHGHAQEHHGSGQRRPGQITVWPHRVNCGPRGGTLDGKTGKRLN